MKVRCNSCGWKGIAENMLHAPNPFDSEDTIVGCPNCRMVEDYAHVCDHDGCWETAARGTPTPERYVWSCHKHIPE